MNTLVHKVIKYFMGYARIKCLARISVNGMKKESIHAVRHVMLCKHDTVCICVLSLTK